MAATTIPKLRPVTERSVKWIPKSPVRFEEFLNMFGPKDFVELVNGVVVEIPMVQLDHEKLRGWLYQLLALYVDESDLGIVLGSRIAVEISEFAGRLPDLFFVHRDRMNLVQQKATYGAPDLVIEVVSPSDRSARLVPLESDYRSLGVPEIVFIDQRKRRIRVLRKQDGIYKEETITSGFLQLKSLDGIRLDLAWLFDEPRPPIRRILDRLLAGRESPRA